MGKDTIKAAWQLSYSSYFPGIPRPLLIHTALDVIKNPLCLLVSKPNLWDMALNT